MRVVLVNKFAHVTGGADRHCLELAQALRERGHDVALLSTMDARNLERTGVFVPCSVTGAEKADLALGRQAGVAATAIWSRRAAAAMRTLIRSFRPDVVHAHKLYPQLSVSPLVVAHRRGVPIVQTVQDYEFVSASPYDHTGSYRDRDEVSSRARLLNTAVFAQKRAVHRRLVTRWVTVSRYVETALRRGGIDAEVLPNFVIPNGHGLPVAERRGVAFVGKLSEEKGVDHVVALADRLPGVPISIAGDGVLRDRVAQAAAAHPTLEYLGRLDRKGVTRLLGDSRVVVVPSLWQEPGALVVPEAMAVGTPVVAYRSGGIAEYVGDGKAGLVVEPNVDELEVACSRLLDDAALWTAASRCGLDAAHSVHSVATHCSRLETVYADAIAASQR